MAAMSFVLRAAWSGACCRDLRPASRRTFAGRRVPGQRPTPPALSPSPPSPSTRMAISSSPGATTSTATGRDLRSPLRLRGSQAGSSSSRSTPTPRAPSTDPRWRPRATAISSSSGRASTRTGRARPASTASSGNGSRRPAPRVATEFQVNIYTPNDQENPRVASDSDGDFMVVWQSIATRTASNGYGVFGRHFDSSGDGAGHRVPGQHPHPRQPDASRRRGRRRRRLRRRLGEQPAGSPGQQLWRLRASASTRRGRRRRPSSRSIPTPSGRRATPRSPLAPTATSWWPGTASTRKARAMPPGTTASSRGVSPPPVRRRRPSSRSTSTALGSSALPAGRLRQRRRLRRHLGEPVPGWQRRRCVRPPRRSATAAFGPEFQANSYTIDGQGSPVVDFDSDGDFVDRVVQRGGPGRQLLRRLRPALQAAAAGDPRHRRQRRGRPAHRRSAQPAAPLRLHRRDAHHRSDRHELHALRPRETSRPTSTASGWSSTSPTTAPSSRSPTGARAPLHVRLHRNDADQRRGGHRLQRRAATRRRSWRICRPWTEREVPRWHRRHAAHPPTR